MYHRVAFFGSVCVATMAAAEPAELSGKTLSEIVPGAMVQLDTPLGTKLPVKYAANGLISGEAGGLSWFLGSANDRGRWWVDADRLCHKWFKWFDAEVQCLKLQRDGQKLYWSRDDGKTGTATLVSANPIEPLPYALGSPGVAREDRDERMPSDPAVTAEQTARPPAAHAVSPPLRAQAAAVPPAKPGPKHVEAVKAATDRAATNPQPAMTKIASLAPPTLPAAVPAAGPRIATPPHRTGASPDAVALQIVSFRVAGVRVDDVLNVRQGPSAETPAVGIIPSQGQGIRLTGKCRLTWCPVAHNGVSGWVNSDYLVEDLVRYTR